MLRESYPLREPDAGNGAGGAGVTPPTPAPSPPPAPPAPAPAKGPSEAEARAKILEELGVKDVAEVKAALEAQRKATEAAKTDAEKAVKAAADLEATQKRLEAAQGTLREQAAASLQGLTEAQRAAIVAVAGDDPAAQLRALHALSGTWAQAPSGQTPPAPPANTAPVGKNPSPAAPPAPANDRERYETLLKTDPYQAAYFLAGHPRALDS